MAQGNSATVRNPSPEMAEEKHFAFGENWRNFLSVLNDDRIAEAEKSLREMLRVDNLTGKRFLDIGSGSGLFSLAARRLGAQVYSFDYDPDSVGCTQELRRRYFPGDTSREWHIEQGSVLDKDYLSKLGSFDIVYSWGVLHHTGNMWQALENAAGNVAPRGTLFIAIYNDEGWRSAVNTRMKKIYNASPAIVKKAMAVGYAVLFAIKGLLIDLLRKKNPLDRYREKIKSRGMSIWYDIVDWLGGWPFEVATPEALFEFYFQRGFDLTKLKTVPRGHGCNEFVFRRRG
jgi:2-polyprenyl-6-hydroxyphenyl methylase/3-demethylubiquinone-9 3-methyltransferase